MSSLMIHPVLSTFVLLVFVPVGAYGLAMHIHLGERTSPKVIGLSIYLAITGVLMTGCSNYENENEKYRSELVHQISSDYGVDVNDPERLDFHIDHPQRVSITHDGTHYEDTYRVHRDQDTQKFTLMIHHDTAENNAPVPDRLRELADQAQQ